MNAPAIISVSLDRIRAEIQAQPRAAMQTDEVARYSEAMTSGDVFPPLVVFFDGAVYWLADGFHRYHAARGLGLAEFDCDVRQGGLRDAVLHAVGANDAHGIQRTREDKERAVKRLLDDPEWSAWSDREVARQCRVSPTFVGKFRPAPSVHVDRPERKVERGGTTYAMATGNIGRRADPAPRPLPAFFSEPSREPDAAPPAYYTQGNGAIFNDLTDVRRMVRRLPEPERAVAEFPDRVRHSFTAADFDDLADWFARAADAWREHERIRHVAAE